MREVLVVEDEALMRLTIIDALDDAGFEVVEAASAYEAVEILNEQTIYLLFTDIQMPGRLSGTDLADASRNGFRRRDNRRLRTLDHRRSPPSSGSCIFSKPYDLSTILDRLNAFANRYAFE